MINTEKLFYVVHKVRLEMWEKQNGELRKIGCTPKTTPLHVNYLCADNSRKFTSAWERAEHGERLLRDFCDICGIDMQKLYGLVRGIQKWHDQRDWQVCFPFAENNEKILEYLRRD